VFFSQSERQAFTALETRWKEHLKVYPNLPLSCLIDADKGDIPKRWENFFFKTSVDYTICDSTERILMAIEFDGIGGGHSRDGKYFPERDTSDAYRKDKLDFKLQIAEESGLPFLVISYDETQQQDEEERLSILDGIIEQFLARKDMQARLEEEYQEQADYLESFPPDIREDLIQNLVLNVEHDQEMRFDPFVRIGLDYWGRCMSGGYVHTEFDTDPPMPDGDPFVDPEVLSQRVDAIKNAKSFRAVTVVKNSTLEGVIVSIPVWVRNVSLDYVDPMHVAGNISEYLACKQACEVMDKMKSARESEEL
jgi:hypothetical protein